MDVETRRALAEFQRELTRLGRETDALKRGKRGPQLAHSSLEEGQALEVRDESGAVRGRIGWVDGAVGTTTEGGDPVSAPSAPTVTPSLGGLRVTWDGTLANDVAIPVDFDHMSVHVSTTSGFTPSAATYVGSIRRAGEGGMLPVVPLPYQPHYVVLVPVTTGGVQGTPSVEVSATPLQVDGPDLTAGSVEAAHIAAGAVEADKLEAILVLATTIIAGIPGAARVELDQDGLRGYDTNNTLVFAVDDTGNAVFSGDITGSQISGSSMTITTDFGASGFIGEGPNEAVARVTGANNTRAHISASETQAEVVAWGDYTDTSTPAGGLLATSDKCEVVLYSDLGAESARPVTSTTASVGLAQSRWRSGPGSEVRIRALPDYASILMSAPPAADPDDLQSAGYLFAQRYASDIAAVSVQGPVWDSSDPAEPAMRSMLHLDGTRPETPNAAANYSAHRHLFQQQFNMDTDSRDASNGIVELADTHSLYAFRHAPVRSDLVANPNLATTAAFVDFTAGEFPSIAFRTSWSGRTRITITAAGSNGNTGGSALDLGFTLSGGSSIPAARSRAWIAVGGTVSHSSRVLYLDLVGNADYTLTPAWRLSSGDSSTAAFITAFENSIVVEPLL